MSGNLPQILKLFFTIRDLPPEPGNYQISSTGIRKLSDIFHPRFFPPDLPPVIQECILEASIKDFLFKILFVTSFISDQQLALPN
jgi:hypothetical protein